MTASQTEERSLLEAVRLAPDDDGPRLVYADYCDEHHDPRGRFIRVQLALAKLSVYDRRRFDLLVEERETLAKYESKWTAPFAGLAAGIVHRRGFIDELNMTARQFLKHADTVFQNTPVRHLHLLDAGQHLPEVLSSPLLLNLAELTIFAQYLGGPGLLAARLAEATALANLQRLHLGRNRLIDNDISTLSRAKFSASLQELDIQENELTDAGIEQLAEAGIFPRLKRLNLSRTGVGPAMATKVARAPHREVFQFLGLAGNPAVGRVTMRGIDLFGVAELDLSETGLTVLGFERYLEAASSPKIRTLRLAGNTLGDGGATTIATSPAFAELRELDLRRNEIGSDGIERMAQSTTLNKLKWLDLTSNPVDPLGWAALLSPKGFSSLRKLELPTAGISPAVREALDRKYNRP